MITGIKGKMIIIQMMNIKIRQKMNLMALAAAAAAQ